MRKQRIRKPRMQHYGFVFTCYRFTSIDDVISRLAPKCKYVVAGLEVCPTTDKHHLQGYLYLEEPRTEGMARRLIKDVHIEPARSGPIENFLYCSKEERYETKGSLISVIEHHMNVGLPPFKNDK